MTQRLDSEVRCVAAALLTGRAAAVTAASRIPRRAEGRTTSLTIAMIAKSSTNPVFLAARTGAEAAAKELSAASTASRSRCSGSRRRRRTARCRRSASSRR